MTINSTFDRHHYTATITEVLLIRNKNPIDMNILVATDYSSAAGAAERYAIKLAMETKSFLRFAHVFRPELSGTTMTFDPEKIDYDPLKYQFDKLYEHVNGLLHEMAVKPGELDHKCTILEGNNIRRQLTQEVDDEGVDLIITGTHSASKLHEWLLGSHTWDLIRNTSVPVLAIPDNTVYKNPKKLLFAVEYREGEIPVLGFLIGLAKGLHADVTVLHIGNTILSEEFETELLNKFKKDIRDKLHNELIDIRLIRHEGIIEELNQYCAEHDASWLVMSPERVSWLDKLTNPADFSISKHMTFHTNTPLLIIPDAYDELQAQTMKNF